MFVLIHMALTSSEPTPFLQTLFNMLISPAAACLLGDTMALFLAYCFGRTNYAPKWKLLLWLAVTALFIWSVYDFLTVGVRKEAHIYKPFVVWQLFLMVVFIPIGAFVYHKKH
ncbi:MAG: hypothetical protein IJE22_02995 [Oscillibacter sp.]|nr:hypothetical protein [Oscillibacter sp.]MBQ2996188.1 hypothetical protein [Oscillibacter sp.]